MHIRLISLQSAVPLLLALCFGASAAAQVPVADGETGPMVGASLPRELPRGLLIPGVINQLESIQTEPLDVPALLAEDELQQSGRRRMGIVRDLAIDSTREGTWTQLDAGGWLWTARITAPGAAAIRLRVEPWNPPPGAELIVSTPDASATWGPLTSSFRLHPTRLWTPTLYTESICVEWYLPPELDHEAAASQLSITGLLNQYLSPWEAAASREMGCHNDASCDGTWANAAAGVGALAGIDMNLPGGFFCSGAMLTRVPADFAPMFMTASHCGVTDENADTTEVTWFWQRTRPPACPDGTVPDANDLQQTQGSTVLVRDIPTDWTLVGLRSGVPGGVVWEGWDPNVLANSSAITGIHHPDGSWKRISYGTKTADNGSRPNDAGTACIAGTSYRVEYRSDLGSGLTEPGSSGSPAFDAAGRVRGTLSCGSANCAGTSTSTYGRFDVAWTLLQPYLLPVDPVYSNTAYGGFERGTVGQPFNSVTEAAHAVIAGSTVHIEAGTYFELPVIDRPMTLRARNGMVTIR